MDKAEIMANLTVLVGAIVILVTPALLGIAFNVYANGRKTLEMNTLAIRSLETKMELLIGGFAEIQKLKADVDFAHRYIREIRATSQSKGPSQD